MRNLRPDGRERPLVVVVCAVPLLGEGLRAALDFVDVLEFSEGGGDLSGLLRWLQPDALVVDSEAVADAATEYALEHDLPVLHISLTDDGLRVFHDAAWARIEGEDGATPEFVRNVVASVVYARGGVR